MVSSLLHIFHTQQPLLYLVFSVCNNRLSLSTSNCLLTFLTRHEFHKNCVDPWLKIKHTCPLCKGSITSKSRNSSSSSASAEDRQQSRPRTTTHTTPVSPSTDSLASTDSSSVTGASSMQLHQMRLLSTPVEVAIDMTETEREDTNPDTTTEIV